MYVFLVCRAPSYFSLRETSYSGLHMDMQTRKRGAVDDLATTCCFLEHQAIGPPYTEILSTTSLAQSASLQIFSSSLVASIATNGVNCDLCSLARKWAIAGRRQQR